MDKHGKEHDLDKTRRWVKESDNTMPPEEIKEWNGMNGGKQDLERAHLQEMLEWSCWIINNKRISLLWDYKKQLKIMR